MEFRSLEGQEMYTGDKIVPLKDPNNFDSDPEEFARTLCKDLDIRGAEVAIAFQSVASARETRISKKGRQKFEHVSSSKGSGIALDLVKLFGGKSSVIRAMMVERGPISRWLVLR
ncbi:hypothetical protein Syun_012011 [Stephania yunnanensis]|uniref:Uncharacterized protein n=1 Tax=Stephania yunnanensis TaxID=152371 RepID=A0AAP0JYL7_9MAGN